MKRVFFLVGGILIAVGIFVCIIIGVTFANDPDTSQQPAWLGPLLQFGIGGFLACLGLIFILVGFRAKAREKKEKALYDHIMLTGVSTDAMVTFVDRNFAIRVNNNPIYSIVEYTYKDRAGKQYTKRYNYYNSEWIIRNQVQVGKPIAIKYAAEDFSKSIMVM